MGKGKRAISVVGALIEEDGKYLVCQRRADDTFGSFWEFPGGKVERGEDKRAALAREIREELGVGIEVGKLEGIFEDELPNIIIRFFLYRCSIAEGRPACLECQAMEFVMPERLAGMQMTPVDMQAVARLRGPGGKNLGSP